MPKGRDGWKFFNCLKSDHRRKYRQRNERPQLFTASIKFSNYLRVVLTSSYRLIITGAYFCYRQQLPADVSNSSYKYLQDIYEFANSSSGKYLCNYFDYEYVYWPEATPLCACPLQRERCETEIFCRIPNHFTDIMVIPRLPCARILYSKKTSTRTAVQRIMTKFIFQVLIKYEYAYCDSYCKSRL